MSKIQGKVAAFELTWTSPPHGAEGTSRVRVGTGELIDVRWKRDSNGIWIELPGGVHGFDIQGERGDDGLSQYTVTQRNAPGSWSGISFLRSGEAATAASAAGVKKGARVRAQMPGKITRVLVKEGQAVERDQPLLVMEAMKMENEIRAPMSGKVAQLKVAPGQAVESGADLLKIEA